MIMNVLCLTLELAHPGGGVPLRRACSKFRASPLCEGTSGVSIKDNEGGSQYPAIFFPRNKLVKKLRVFF